MLFTVVAVGDGACSVVHDWPRSDIMIADCGTAGNAGVSASEALATELDWYSVFISTVVVTHFDADHWRGLRDLPKYWVHRPIGEVKFRYPALLPGDAGHIQKAHLAFQAARLSGPIFGALDFIGEWERDGVAVRREPSSRGDSFTGGGTVWKIHWPPLGDQYFDKGAQLRMRRLGSEVRRLAEKVPQFAIALDAVQHTWFNDNDGPLRNDPALQEVTGEQLFEAIRDELGNEKADAFTKSLRKFTNELSMVHSSELIANFGDCEKGGLKALFRTERTNATLAASYPIILAPHHGTATTDRTVQDQFPRALFALVSQNGKTRYQQGLKVAQTRLKDAVTDGVGRKINTYEPALSTAGSGRSVRFWFS